MASADKLRTEVEAARVDTPEATALRECLALRAKFMAGDVGGLDFTEPYVGPIFAEVLDAMAKVKQCTEDAAVRKLAVKQLKLNEHAFGVYMLENEPLEREQAKNDGANESYYSVPKVDTHLHLSACMTTAELLDFLGELYNVHGTRDIEARDGSKTTIAKMMDAEGFAPGKIDEDAMETMSSAVMLRNFEAFNQAFVPMGSKPLKDLIFKPRTLDGEFLRLFIKRVVDKAQRRNTILEPRISVKGRKRDEWEKLAKWVYAHKGELERPHLLWAVQVPRVYQVWHGRNVQSFGDLITNFFAPLFEATLKPEEHVELAWFLEQVGIIDTVDNEDKVDGYDLSTLPAAAGWTTKDNPPYGYYHFYFWANLCALNKLRTAKQLRPITLRPHGGEAGPVHHLASAFLFAENISHGINLIKEPTLEYLYYMAQIGCSVSPISNKALFIPYTTNPFPLFFRRGLNVTLTTDDPLMFHMTPTPLLEEYASARLVWGLTMVDLCEIAHHSVFISSLTKERKAKLGKQETSNVPSIRFAFRKRQLELNKKVLGMASALPLDLTPRGS